MYLAEVKAVAFAVISSGYRSQALLYTHSDQRYCILDDTVYTIPRSTVNIRASLVPRLYGGGSKA